jgi:hypothetical protein
MLRPGWGGIFNIEQALFQLPKNYIFSKKFNYKFIKFNEKFNSNYLKSLQIF